MSKRRSTTKHVYQDKTRGVRIQKVLAEAGIDSRRHCELLVEEGRVVVNGTMIKSLPAWVDPTKDKITVDGRPIKKPRQLHKGSSKSTHENIYLMLNKPRSVVSTNRDPEGRRCAIDLIQYPGNPRLFCVGRLDADSTGLLLMTNDGELANKLTHPKYGVHKTYEVTIKGSLDTEQVAKLQQGIYLSDKRKGDAAKTAAVRLHLIKRDRDRTSILMELREGRNRQIRRMMANLGHPVKKLKRVSLGSLKLKGVQVGFWRALTAQEIKSLKRDAGKVKIDK